jgi:putative ABC transport system substrate-binding protein
LRETGYGGDGFTQYCYSSLSEVPSQVREILATKPTVLLVWGSAFAAKAVRDATTTLPVVFADVADPVKNGLVASLAHPGGNMTGLTNVTEELVAKRIELLKEALPSLTRIAVLGNVTNPEQPSYFRVAQEAAHRLHAEARLYPIETQTKLASAFSEMEADHMQALLLLPDAWFYPLRTEIVALAAKHRIPAIYGNTAYADAGGLLVYGVNLSSLNVKVIVYLDKILKGAKPGDLPVERPSQFDFIVNQQTARDIGVTVSAAALLRATKVVE